MSLGMKIDYVKRGPYDELYTPPEAVLPLLKYLPLPPLTVWEPCDPGNSEISRVLREAGYRVVSTNITTGFDFISDNPDFDFDIIITNPPYSLKNKFLEGAYSYKKPFALLLPITALEGKTRGKMFKERGISVIVLDSRINFKKEKGSSSWFNVSWFVWKIVPDNNLFFESVEQT